VLKGDSEVGYLNRIGNAGGVRTSGVGEVARIYDQEHRARCIGHIGQQESDFHMFHRSTRR
jgi:hypothetical protein